MLSCIRQRSNPNYKHRKVAYDSRSYASSYASESVFKERSNYSAQTVVSEAEHLRFILGHSACCLHESSLNMDSDMGVRRKKQLSEVQAGKGYPMLSLRGPDSSTSEIRKQGNAFIVSRQSQNKALNKVKEQRSMGPVPSDVNKAHSQTNQVAIFAEDDEAPAETAGQGSPHMVESFKANRTNLATRESRAAIETVSNFEMESGVTEQIGGQLHVAGCSGCFGCVTNAVQSLPSERSTLATHGSSEIVSQGLHYRKSNVGSCSSGRGSNCGSWRKFSCISSADVLPSVTNPLANGVPNHVFNRQKAQTHNVKHRGGASGFRIRKNALCSAGCMVHRNSQIESGSLISEQTVPVVNSLPPRSRRVSVAVFKGSKWCLKMPNSMKSDNRVSRSSVAYVSGAIQASNAGHSGRGRESARMSTESCRESASPSVIGSSNSNSNSAVGLSGIEPGQIDLDRKNTTRTWVNYGISNPGRSFLLGSHSGCSSIFSGPPSTLRTPSVPSLGMPELTRSVDALSSPSSYMSSPDMQITNSGFHFAYASMSQSPDLSREVSSPECHDERGMLPAETPVYRPYQQRSLEENQMRFTYDGISQVLLGREHVERDRISNEQYFMLEANLLFGGIAAYDQHRDMRLDVDNMSYEELLALEESIGSVCTGLGKDVISRCLKSKKYAFSHSNSNVILEENEVKCSVCQEEFEEGVQLGVLECGHSHHFPCIEQWLLQKNICPICKTSVSL